MKIETIKTAELIPYARNAKLHSKEQVASIAASIQEFGFNNPVLIDADNGIIAGHGRVMAAEKLGLEKVPCIRLNHLTENQKRAYIIADNRLAETGCSWSQEILLSEVQAIDWGEFDNFNMQDLEIEDTEAYVEEMISTREAEETLDDDITEEKGDSFEKEMADKQTTGKAPIIPQYAEHHQAFVIVCDNKIDETYIRARLNLEEKKQSYKDSDIRRANVISAKEFIEAIK